MDNADLTVTPRLAAKAILKHDSVRNIELLLLPERVVRLNASGAAILSLCDGNRTVGQVVSRLEKDFGASGLAGDILTFLDCANAQGWVVLT